MEIKHYLQIIRRWAWLLALGVVLGLAGGFVGSLYQTPVYQASTRVMVSSAPQGMDSYAVYYGDQQLLQTYVQLVTTSPVLAETSNRLGFSVNKNQVSASQVATTRVILITVQAGDPQQAAQIANTLVDVLVAQNDALQAGRFAASEASLENQIAQVEAQIASLESQVEQISTLNVEEQLREVEAQLQPLQDEVARLQQENAALEPAWNQERRKKIAENQTRIDQLMPLLNLYQQIYSNLVVLGKPVDSGSEDFHLTRLQNTLNLYQEIYLNLIKSRESIRLARLQNTPNVVQIEPAQPPAKPIQPQPLRNTLLAGAVGLLLTAGVAFLIEYLDDTLKSPEDVERVLGLPVIGYIAEMQYPKDSPQEVYVTRQPRSPVSEAFRALRTNLEFAGVDAPLVTLLVTSAGPGDGKTTIAANLAAIISQGGKRVILIDADLRRPQLHRFFGLPNRVGLSDLFREQASPMLVSHAPTGLPNLRVITSGPLPPNPTELLGSEKMNQLLGQLKTQAQVILIDTPPSLVADAQVLSARVDGVLIVIYPGHTHADSARTTLEMFTRSGANIVGVVFNRIPRNRAYYYGGYRYYSPYEGKYEAYLGGETKSRPPTPPLEEPQPELAENTGRRSSSLLSRFIQNRSMPDPSGNNPPTDST